MYDLCATENVHALQVAMKQMSLLLLKIRYRIAEGPAWLAAVLRARETHMMRQVLGDKESDW